MGSIDYHLSELEIALNGRDARHNLPDVLDDDRVILDIGCGVGQSLVALGCQDRLRVGIDVDAKAVAYGVKRFGADLRLVVADAARIPFPPDTFDLVFCRVSLPYTNIPRVVAEIARVLTPRGRIWMTLHEHARAQRELADAIAARSPRRVLHRLYVLANGHFMRVTGRLLPYANGSYESWQHPNAMRRLLERHGFKVELREAEGHLTVEGRLARDADKAGVQAA